ncbi:MAG: F0F1 ATP synthase subunit A [Clostridia bacterium]|nr:F0F1 ATP synthase subunit A [Clostridia bacterium]
MNDEIKKPSLKFKIVDIIYIIMMVLPLVCGMVLDILTTPASSGVNIAGARIYYEIDLGGSRFFNIIISEAQVNSVLVMITIFFVFLYLTHGLKERIELKRQHLAEIIVQKVDGLVGENMGSDFSAFGPFIIAIMALSAFSSLTSLLGLYPPTSDMNVVAGWAILVFMIITYYKLKCGPLYYLNGFTKPVFILAPINFISEFATPVSMAFRHYGNVMSGGVISVLLSTFLAWLSGLVLGWAGDYISAIPIFQVGLPAIFSIYFDIFSGCLQAFIFAMLTMLNISGAFDAEEYERRKKKKLEKKKLKNINGGN